MKKIYRYEFVDDYWEKRWGNSEVDSDKFVNMNIYPIKYAEMVVGNSNNILEAGCGNGRVLFHYKRQGKDIKGIDYSINAINNIKEKDPDLDIIQGSILDLPYDDESFDCVLAFGLYHGIEEEKDLHRAFKETVRVMKPNAKIVFSVRANSLENDILEYFVRSKNKDKVFNKFHKWQFDEQDIKYFAQMNGLKIQELFYVQNVSVLFKFNIFKNKTMKKGKFDEAMARSDGFKLNFLGRTIDRVLHKRFPKYFSNLIVIIAEKDI